MLICFLLPGLSQTAGQGIPESSRSREVIARIKPVLEKTLQEHGLNIGSPVFIRIYKEEKELELFIMNDTGFKLFRTYSVCTWGNKGLGPKIRQGDGKAPEGFYYVVPGRLNPLSNFHLSFNIGYPNEYDRYHKRSGSYIMVHGSCVSIGCFAMTDPVIEEIYTIIDSAFRNGQPFFRIHTFPFRMTDENMNRYRDSKWYEFWKNLKEGYDFFEDNGNIPPDVKVSSGKYIFE